MHGNINKSEDNTIVVQFELFPYLATKLVTVSTF